MHYPLLNIYISGVSFVLTQFVLSLGLVNCNQLSQYSCRSVWPLEIPRR